jgi:hypothetical protein
MRFALPFVAGAGGCPLPIGRKPIGYRTLDFSPRLLV